MANIGFSELIVILMILVLVFGASRLPDLGESLGKSMRNLKRGLAENQDIKVTPVDKQVAPKSGADTSSANANANVSEAELVDEKKRES